MTKYRKSSNTKKKFIGGLVGAGSTKLLSSLGVDEKTASMIGSGAGAITGFATGDIVGGVMQSGNLASQALNEFSNDSNVNALGDIIGSGASLGAAFIKPTPMSNGGPVKEKNSLKTKDDEIEYDYVTYGSPEYEKAYREKRFANIPNMLDEVVITPYDEKYPFYKDLSPEEKQYIDDSSPIGRYVRGKALDGVGFNSKIAKNVATGVLKDVPLSSLQVPQSLMVEAIEAARGNEFNFSDATTLGKQRTPSETLGFDTEDLSWYHPKSIANFAMDVVTDPSILTGVGVARKPIQKGLQQTGKYLTTQTPLRDAYKINPWVFKPQEGMMYRGIGKEGFEDAIQSGVFRPRNPEKSVNIFTTDSGRQFNLGKSFDQTYYSPNFKIADRYGKGYIAEVPNSSADFTRRYSNKDWSYRTNRQIPIEEGRILQKDWLKGYKQIDVPKQQFKSEIDWSKWNPDTPKHKVLMDEYNAIEESTKKAGTWMKNPDGSAFQGTPEQFIQQQSSWFKKAFPQGSNVSYRGDLSNLSEIKSQQELGKEALKRKYNLTNEDTEALEKLWERLKDKLNSGKYTTNDYEAALKYAKGDKNKVLSLYTDIRNPKFTETGESFRVLEKDRQKLLSEGYDALITKPSDFYPEGENVLLRNNQIKSAVGNVGFFDMTNPNIYKSLIPPAAIIGAGATQLGNEEPVLQFQQEGSVSSSDQTKNNKPMAEGGQMNNTSDDFLNFVNTLAANRGNTPENLLDFVRKVGYHESAHTFDPMQKQVDGGPAKGIYQWESQRIPDSITRLKVTYGKLGLEVPAFLERFENRVEELKKEGKDVNEAIFDLNRDEQSILFLADIAEHKKSKIGKINADTTFENWRKAWWAGDEKDVPKKLERFNESLSKLEKEGLDVYSNIIEGPDEALEQSLQEEPVQRNKLNTLSFPNQQNLEAINNAQNNLINNSKTKENLLNSPTRRLSTANRSLELKYGGNMKKYAMGGPLEDLGVQEFNVGGSHEENQLGGISLNNGYSVEEGETRVGDFVFSDRLKINKTLAKEFSLPEKLAGLSFAEASKKMKDKYSFRENDPLTEESIDNELGRLSEAQEAFKAHKKQKDVEKLLREYPELAQELFQPQDPMQDMGVAPEMGVSEMQDMGSMQGIEGMDGMEQMMQEQPMAVGGTMDFGFRMPSMDLPLRKGGFGVQIDPINTDNNIFNLNQAKAFNPNLQLNKGFTNPTQPSNSERFGFGITMDNTAPTNTKAAADAASKGNFNTLAAGKAGVGLLTGLGRLAMNKRPQAIDEGRYYEPVQASRIDINPQLAEATRAFSGARRAVDNNAPNAGNLISNKAMIAAQEAATKAGIAGQEAARFTSQQDRVNELNAANMVKSRQIADQANMFGEMAYRQNLDTLLGDLGDFGGEVFNQLSNEQKLNLLIERGMINPNYDFRGTN